MILSKLVHVGITNRMNSVAANLVYQNDVALLESRFISRNLKPVTSFINFMLLDNMGMIRYFLLCKAHLINVNISGVHCASVISLFYHLTD
jgi:hypothetical protein